MKITKNKTILVFTGSIMNFFSYLILLIGIVTANLVPEAYRYPEVKESSSYYIKNNASNDVSPTINQSSKVNW